MILILLYITQSLNFGGGWFENQKNTYIKIPVLLIENFSVTVFDLGGFKHIKVN